MTPISISQHFYNVFTVNPFAISMRYIIKRQYFPLKVTVKQLSTLYDYLNECVIKGFHGPYNFTGVYQVREYLYTWHLLGLIQSLDKKLLSILKRKQSNSVSIRLNEPEVMVIKALLHRVDLEKFDIDLEKIILK